MVHPTKARFAARRNKPMPSSVTQPSWMEVDLDALDNNVSEVRRRVGPTVKMIASVKANAYGHGVVPVARRLVAGGVQMLATGSFRDAVALRKAGIETPILMFGTSLPSVLPEFVELGLTPTVHNAEMVDAAAAHAQRPLSVFIKIDCGFGRLGIPLRDARRFVVDTARQSRIEVTGLYTHLPFFDKAGYEWASERISKFDDLVAALARDGLTIPITQARASAAIVTGIEDHCTAVCPGGILYGNSPVKGLGDMSGFRPVMASVRSRLIHISHGAGDRTPGYEGIYAARVKGATGVVPFGRNDGYRAAVAGKTAYMLLGGVKVPVLGVSLEHCVLDLSAVDDPQIGGEVVIMGRSGRAAITHQRIAEWWGMGVNDVLMMFNDRIMQRFLPAASSECPEASDKPARP